MEAGHIPQLLPMLKEFSDFAGGKIPLYSTDEVVAGFLLHLRSQAQPFFIAVQDGQIVGFIAAILAPHIFNPSIRVLTELFWWVKPAYRGSRAGLMLLEAMTAYAKDHADMFVMTLEHKSPVRLETLEKRGFELRERNFILDIVRR